MSPTRTVHQEFCVAVFAVLVLLAFAVNSGSHVPSKADQDLVLILRTDPDGESQFRVPKFRADLRNIANHDLVLNLGVTLANGRNQYPNAVVLTLTDSQGKSRLFDLKEPAFVAGRMDPFVLPLPTGAAFSLPIDLERYWAAASKEFDYKLQPGTYSLEARFSGRSVTQPQANLDMKGLALMPYWTGTVTSNRLQFEVSK